MRLNVVGSEECPYSEHGDCGCTHDCTVDSICTLDHHPVFKGKSKLAFYGIIGLDRHVRKVHDAMKAINYNDGVYTLIMDPMGEYEAIAEEIGLFDQIKAVDPTGEFTPLLLHYTKISQGSADFYALRQISQNIKTYQKEVSKILHEGDEFIELVEENLGELVFMYVTDAGKSLYEYAEEEGLTAPVEDIISATSKLMADYQMLAKHNIGHYDLHGNNIMCRVRNRKLCFSIIDFGFGFLVEHGVRRNVLHLLFSRTHFDNIENTRRSIRNCDAVHYNMFIMCFGMLRRCLQQYNPATTEHVRNIMNDMHNMAFSDKTRTATTEHVKNFMCFEDIIIQTYEIFYDKAQLQDIWQRVCIKAHEAIERFLNTIIDGIHQLSERLLAPDSLNRLPIQRKYRPDNDYMYYSTVTNAYTIIFDDFSMAYYDMNSVVPDQVFLRKKFDEYSIAFMCVYMLNDVSAGKRSKQDQIQLEIQINHFQKAFASPYFFLQNDSPSKRKYEISGQESPVSRLKRQQPSPPPIDMKHSKPYSVSLIK